MHAQALQCLHTGKTCFLGLSWHSTWLTSSFTLTLNTTVKIPPHTYPSFTRPPTLVNNAFWVLPGTQTGMSSLDRTCLLVKNCFIDLSWHLKMHAQGLQCLHSSENHFQEISWHSTWLTQASHDHHSGEHCYQYPSSYSNRSAQASHAGPPHVVNRL